MGKMRRISVTLALLWIFAPTHGLRAAEAEVPPRLPPTGIHGAVVALGEAAEPASIARLLADDENRVTKVLLLGESAAAEEVAAVLKDAKVDFEQLDSQERAAEKLKEAGANAVVWSPADGFRDELRAARERGAMIVGPATTMLTLCPDLKKLDQDASPAPGKVGVFLEPKSVLLVFGRTLISHTEAPVQLKLAASRSRAARTITLNQREPADYNELRRAAWGRTRDAYPPPLADAPEVPRGALVIVGGGGLPQEIAERFFELGGGKEGRFVILPTAMPDRLPVSGEARFLERLGAKHISVIRGREQAELETPETLALLDEATAIWFGGGRQWRFVDAYEGTKVYERLHQVLARGGVIGGSSAGATIQGEYLVRGAPAGPHIMMCEGYERGFAFLPGVAIDQHFKQRQRFGDMTALMKVYPQYLGIGLDEATALVVQGSTAEVLGSGQVHFFDRRLPIEPNAPDYQSYSAGKQYDLKARKLVD